jgi:hypothetical protein
LNLEDQLRGIGGAAIAMIAVIDKTPMSFDEFIDWYPDSENRYELRGNVLDMWIDS